MVEINNLTKKRISQQKIKNFLKKLFKILKIKRNLSLAFVNSRKTRELNKVYLKKDKITDVLSFKGEGEFLGEIVISLPQAKKQAKLEKHSLEKEIKILTLHGLLHLKGFDHQISSQREKMRKKEKEILKFFKL